MRGKSKHEPCGFMQNNAREKWMSNFSRAKIKVCFWIFFDFAKNRKLQLGPL
jgi:hypothetical protein